MVLLAPAAAASAQEPAAPGRDDSPAAAAAIVTSYFARINAATTSGQVAVLADLALPGCEDCAVDLGVTRSIHDRGLHADRGALDASGVAAQPRLANGITVRYTLLVHPQTLLDAAGQVAGSYQGQAARSGTAVLALTRAGWRIQTFVYAARTT